MPFAIAVFALLFSMTVNAQNLPEKPRVPHDDERLSVTPGPFVRQTIGPNTPPPEGTVWVAEQGWWTPKLINSCGQCGRPMTFKQAAFDRAAIEMWGSALALETANVVVAATRPCVQQLTCRDALGRPTIRRGMAIQFPALGALWMGTAYLRKGNLRLHKGGTRAWWVVAMIHQGFSAAFVAATLARY